MGLIELQYDGTYTITLEGFCMSLLALMMTIARELLPFLKEALLEGQSFRVWLRSNWLTFVFLLSSLALTLMVAYLSDLVRDQRVRAELLRGQIVALAKPTEVLISRYRELETRNRELTLELQELEEDNGASLEVIERYQEWMQQCGVNIETGQCRISRAPVRPSRPKQETPSSQSVPDETEKRRGFLRRLRDLLTRNDPEETP